MADMTRNEARGILQQLVKQQTAVARLAEALVADTALEAEVVGLREQHAKLTTTVTDLRVAAAQAQNACNQETSRLAGLRSTADALAEEIGRQRRDAAAEHTKLAHEVATAQQDAERRQAQVNAEAQRAHETSLTTLRREHVEVIAQLAAEQRAAEADLQRVRHAIDAIRASLSSS